MRNPRNVLLVVLLMIVGGAALFILLLQANTPGRPIQPATSGVEQFDPLRLKIGSETPTEDRFLTWSAQMEETDMAATNAVQTEAATP
jgi:flagellar basal body-associated protein FliL